MAMAALPSTSSGLSPLAVPGAALRVATSRRAFLRIPAAAHAPAPAPLVSIYAQRLTIRCSK
jgi:hypothetical protein